MVDFIPEGMSLADLLATFGEHASAAGVFAAGASKAYKPLAFSAYLVGATARSLNPGRDEGFFRGIWDYGLLTLAAFVAGSTVGWIYRAIHGDDLQAVDKKWKRFDELSARVQIRLDGVTFPSEENQRCVVKYADLFFKEGYPIPEHLEQTLTLVGLEIKEKLAGRSLWSKRVKYLAPKAPTSTAVIPQLSTDPVQKAEFPVDIPEDS